MKYYVASYDLQRVIDGPHIEDAKQAAIETMLCFASQESDKELAPFIIVSERGFNFIEHEDSEDSVFFTEAILKEAGLIQ